MGQSNTVRESAGLLGIFIQRLFLALLILAIAMIGWEVISRRLNPPQTIETPHTTEELRENGLPVRRCGSD
jgi:Na+-transporting methylmalonyl-CoA/oxaloacetate decarboxylase gamma subunit